MEWPFYFYVYIFAGLIFFLITIWDYFTLKINSYVNYFMILVIMLTYGFLPGKIITNYLILISIFLLIYGLTEFYKKGYSSGDIELFYWVIPTLNILTFWAIPTFFIFLAFLYLFQTFLMKEFKKNILPGTPHIFGAFLLSTLISLLW